MSKSVWVCSACGNIKRDRYDFADASCAVNAVEYIERLEPTNPADDDLDELLHVYENTLAIAIQIEGNATRLKALKKCREQAKAALLKWRTTAQQQAYEEGYDDRTLEADHELEDDERQLLSELMGQKQTCYDCVHDNENLETVDFVPVSVIQHKLDEISNKGEK